MKKDKISFHGAARLRKERERIGFSQADAEELFGISRVTWGKYERGEGTPGADVLTALAKAGADVLYILTGHHDIGILTPDESALLDNYRALPDGKRYSFAEIAAALSEKEERERKKVS